MWGGGRGGRAGAPRRGLPSERVVPRHRPGLRTSFGSVSKVTPDQATRQWLREDRCAARGHRPPGQAVSHSRKPKGLRELPVSTVGFNYLKKKKNDIGNWSDQLWHVSGNRKTGDRWDCSEDPTEAEGRVQRGT